MPVGTEGEGDEALSLWAQRVRGDEALSLWAQRVRVMKH